MAITDAVRKRLWALSGNQCAFPGRNQSLIVSGRITPEEAKAEGLRILGPERQTARDMTPHVNQLTLSKTSYCSALDITQLLTKTGVALLGRCPY